MTMKSSLLGFLSIISLAWGAISSASANPASPHIYPIEWKARKLPDRCTLERHKRHEHCKNKEVKKPRKKPQSRRPSPPKSNDESNQEGGKI